MPNFNRSFFKQIDSEDQSEVETNKTNEEPEEKATDKMEVASEHPEEQIREAELMETEAEGSSMFRIRIENVVSLNQVDEADSLDPITTADYSNVIVAKNAVTFPYCASHDRPSFAARLKDEDKYKQMLDYGRVKNLFKCMAYRCIFSCELAKDFKNHLDWHHNHFLKPNHAQPIVEHRMLEPEDDKQELVDTVTLPDFFFCSYCPFGTGSSSQLVEHVERTHGKSSFQCPVCFFRAKSPKMVDIHSIICHPKMKVHSLNCNRPFSTGTNSQVDQLTLKDHPRYRCCVDDCGFSCILRISFIKHMSTCHAGVKQFPCRLCTKDIVCNSSDYTQFFLHMNVHDVGYFQCAFCLWGGDLPTNALIHMCLHHPTLEGKVFARSSPEVLSGSKTLLIFWKPGIPHAYTRIHHIDFDIFYRELFNKVQVIETAVSPEEDIVILPSTVEKSQAAEEPIEVPPVELEEIAVDGDPPAQKEQPEAEFHGFGEEEQAKAKEQTECIVIESDGEEENSSSATNQTPSAANQPAEETPDQESEENQDGFSGSKLYMCGNIGCDETAETASAFKVHSLF